MNMDGTGYWGSDNDARNRWCDNPDLTKVRIFYLLTSQDGSMGLPPHLWIGGEASLVADHSRIRYHQVKYVICDRQPNLK